MLTRMTGPGSAAASARLLAAVERVCARSVDSRRVRADVLDRMSREMPVDAYAFVLTDPATGVGVDPLASIPDVRELPRLIALRYTTSLQRWTNLDDDVVSLASTPTAVHGPWQRYVLARGFVDVASMVLRDRHGCWGFVDLWSQRLRYSEHDLSLLRDLQPVLTATMRRCQASTFAAPAPAPASREAVAEGPTVLLLEAPMDRGLVITGSTPGTDAWLARLLPPDSGRAPVPAAVLNVAAQLLAREAGVDDAPAVSRVHVGDAVWLRLRASRIDPSGQIAVTIELAAPADRVDVFARAHGLSPRERELLDILAEGLDTSSAAARLFVTPNTVQDHLKSVFAKSGVHSRRELLGRLLGSAAHPS